MVTKSPPPITPQEFRVKKLEYSDALHRRKLAILMQAQNMTQQEIADFWKLDISRVNRIIKKYEAETV